MKKPYTIVGKLSDKPDERKIRQQEAISQARIVIGDVEKRSRKLRRRLFGEE